MKIFQEEESIRQNREESENFRNAFSEPVLSEPVSEGEIKANLRWVVTREARLYFWTNPLLMKEY